MQAVSDGYCQQTSIICECYPQAMNAWFDRELEWTERRLLANLDIREPSIRMLLQRLAHEARHPGFASEALVELIAVQIAIELVRYHRAIDCETAPGGLSGWRLGIIDERLGEVREPPTLSELAELCHISVRQLTRGFRVSRGCSIGDYIASKLVDHARHLLATEQSVKAIAYSLGFASSSAFCFAFRRATGETPTQYRLGWR